MYPNLQLCKLREKINLIVKCFCKLNCKCLRGSYSVEAAFIVPIIFGILFAMLYLLFFLHDKAVLYGNINRELIFVSEGESVYVSDNKWQDKIQENLWILHVSGGEISDKKLYVTGDAVAQSEWRIPIMQKFINNKLKLTIKVKHNNILPGEMLWAKKLKNSS